MTDDGDLKSMMYDAGSTDDLSIITNRQDAIRVMRLFKAYGDRSITTMYSDAEQIERNKKKLYATILKMEPMTSYVESGEQRIPTSQARDIVLCIGPLVCIPLSTFDPKDMFVEDLKELTYKLLRVLIDCCKPSPAINGSFGDLKTSYAALDCIYSQLVMDGIEDTEEKESRSWWSMVYMESRSVIHSMCTKLILDYEKVIHVLPSTEEEASNVWKEFEARAAKDFATSKGSG